MRRHLAPQLAPGEFVPPAVVDFVGRQLDLDGDDLADYAVRSETRHEHLAEGQTYELTVTAATAVDAETEIAIRRDAAMSDADEGDYEVASVMIAAGATSGSTRLTITKDGAPDADRGDPEMLTRAAYGRAVGQCFSGADPGAAPRGASARAAGGAAVETGSPIAAPGFYARRRDRHRPEPTDAASPMHPSSSIMPSVLRGCVQAPPRAPRAGRGVRPLQPVQMPF